MTDTEAKWKDRVQAWRSSGKTAEAFVADEDFEASTLRYWASRLKGELKASGAAVSSAPSQVAMARVIRRRRSRATASPSSASELELVVGGARITVGRGFDAGLLREIVLALGGAE